MSKIHHLFEQVTQRLPNQCAVSHLNHRVTYAALNAQANQMAHLFLQQGIKPGYYVPVIADKSIPTIAAILALLKIGAVYVPVSPDSPESVIQSILADTKAQYTLVQSGVRLKLSASIRSLLLEDLSRDSKECSDKNPVSAEHPEDEAYIMHTSGSTGKPKGVVVSHQNLMQVFASWQSAYQLTPGDRHLQMAPFTFDVFTGDWVRALCSGGQLVLCPKEVMLNPSQLYALIADQKITCGEFVPAVLKRLLDFAEKEKLSLSSFRLLICGSDQWTMQDYRRAQKLCGFQTRVINSYGLTEGTIDSTYFEADEKSTSLPDAMIVPIGKPFFHARLYILDEKHKPVKVGDIGEIYIGGPGIAQGYLALEDMTKERFIFIEIEGGKKERVYKTGDLAYYLLDGNIAFLGRHQTQVKVNGQRVELPAIENRLQQHPKIKQAVVTPVEVEGIMQIHCFLVAAEPITHQELIDHLKQTLPCYCVPKHFYEMKDISLTTSGKVDRRSLQQKARREIKPQSSAPRNPLEIQIVRIWADTLKLNFADIGREHAFADLGGTSLEYVMMREALHRELGLPVSLSKNLVTIPALADQVHFYRQNRKHKIAIIGGGPAAVAALMQLIAELKETELAQEVEIVIYEKSDKIGSGLPYSFADDCYILNLPKQVMEPVFGQKGKFAEWLKGISQCPQDTDFPPRHYFGQYLQFLAEQVQNSSDTSGILIKYYTHCEVLDIQSRAEERYWIHTTQGDYESHYVILCTGHMPTATYRHLIGTKGYQHHPWSPETWSDIKPMDHVGIIGTRLTAIDTALKLFASGHQGPVSMVSRTGLLPTVLSRTIPAYSLRYLTLDNFTHLTRSNLEHLPLETLMDLFWKEISTAENKTMTWESLVKSDRDMSPLEWIEREIKQAESGPKPWQQVLFAIYPIVSNIWTYLSFADRKQFLDKYYSVFMTYLAAFPLENAYKIQFYLQTGQLRVYGGLQDIHAQDWHYQLRFNGRTPITPQHLINATGPGYNPLSIPLYANMYRHRLIRPHHLGGIQVDPRTLEVGDSGKLFAIGELTRGACLATTDMGRVSFQATRVCLQIRQSLQHQHAQSLPKLSLAKPVAHSYNPSVFFPKPRLPIRATAGIGVLAAGLKMYQSWSR